jgi:hypothetical protein
MTSVNITTVSNTVDVTTETGTVVVQVPVISTVTAITEGPQGPSGNPQDLYFSELNDVDTTGKVDQSVVYYSAADAKFKADGLNTILSLTDGGNF